MCGKGSCLADRPTSILHEPKETKAGRVPCHICEMEICQVTARFPSKTRRVRFVYEMLLKEIWQVYVYGYALSIFQNGLYPELIVFLFRRVEQSVRRG